MTPERQHIGDAVAGNAAQRDSAGRDVLNTWVQQSPELTSLDRLHTKVDELTDRVIHGDERIDELWTELHELRKLTMRLYGAVASDTDRNIQYTRLVVLLIVVIEVLVRVWPT